MREKAVLYFSGACVKDVEERRCTRPLLLRTNGQYALCVQRMKLQGMPEQSGISSHKSV